MSGLGRAWVQPLGVHKVRPWTFDEELLIAWFLKTQLAKRLPSGVFRINKWAEIHDTAAFYAWLNDSVRRRRAETPQAINGIVAIYLQDLKEYCDAKNKKGSVQAVQVEPPKKARKVRHLW